MASSAGVDPAIFEDLQQKVDEDTAVRDELKDTIATLEKQTRSTLAVLSRAHSTPTSQISDIVSATTTAIQHELETISKLSAAATRQPYYKYNQMWSRQVTQIAFTILFCGWLGGYDELASVQPGRLLRIEDVGKIMGVPVNLKSEDAFHLSIEEYLFALLDMVEELARLARNSVTLGDYRRPQQISQFIKDLHAGFQILNLKNDSLRRRTDGLKYRVKEVEDVVYDLSLRNLIPKEHEVAEPVEA